MMEKKNIILIVVALFCFFISLGFLVWSFTIENKENNNQTAVNNTQAIKEPETILDEKEVSNTTNVEGVDYKDITVYTEDEKEVKLSDYKDSSTMILFWNPENEDSVEILKKIDEKAKEYEGKVNFLMVSSSKEIPEEIKNEISMDIYYDLDKEYETKYNVTEFPTMVYIYKDNTILNAKSGMPSMDAIEANLDILSDNI